MAEYIEREALKERFRKRINWLEKDVHDQYSLGLFHGCEYDADLINEPPAADVAPVRHGRWVIKNRHTASSNPYMDDDYFASATCSECNFCIESKIASFSFPKLNTTRYCPNCGAKMMEG